ncbi:MAG: hypothetical protein K6C05_02705 [Anaerovibrio sp.]|nr:hypothetical protein [Anaerovibrio sp.]
MIYSIISSCTRSSLIQCISDIPFYFTATGNLKQWYFKWQTNEIQKNCHNNAAAPDNYNAIVQIFLPQKKNLPISVLPKATSFASHEPGDMLITYKSMFPPPVEEGAVLHRVI